MWIPNGREANLSTGQAATNDNDRDDNHNRATHDGRNNAQHDDQPAHDSHTRRNDLTAQFAKMVEDTTSTTAGVTR